MTTLTDSYQYSIRIPKATVGKSYETSLHMSKELAEQFDGDLSASEETRERARQARKQGAALDIEWDTAFEVYYPQAGQDPKKLIRVRRPNRWS